MLFSASKHRIPIYIGLLILLVLSSCSRYAYIPKSKQLPIAKVHHSEVIEKKNQSKIQEKVDSNIHWEQPSTSMVEISTTNTSLMNNVMPNHLSTYNKNTKASQHQTDDFEEHRKKVRDRYRNSGRMLGGSAALILTGALSMALDTDGAGVIIGGAMIFVGAVGILIFTLSIIFTLIFDLIWRMANARLIDPESSKTKNQTQGKKDNIAISWNSMTLGFLFSLIAVWLATFIKF